jgi:hypothetical protein
MQSLEILGGQEGLIWYFFQIRATMFFEKNWNIGKS